MLSKEEREAFEGMDESYRKAEEEAMKSHPKCHFRLMSHEFSDYESWFECSVCGHTKDY